MESDWYDLLTRWNRDLLACADITAQLSPEVVRAGWLGYPPASEVEIRQTEERLNVTLPVSYRAFLRVTNGWRSTGFFIERLLPIEEVDWYRHLHPEAIDGWLKGARLAGGPRNIPDDEYLVYGDEQRSDSFRVEYLQSALQVSDTYETNVYVLNPQLTFADGEWEAWFHAHWLAGAKRYRSFRALMEAEYLAFRRLAAEQ